MKCDELKPVFVDMSGNIIANELGELYYKPEVDAAIAELKAANKLLKEHIANGDVSRITWIDEVIELKQKLESVQASMYCDVVDANMENRRLHRALYKACAEWALSTLAWLDCIDQGNPVKWGEMRRKCLEKVEEYK